MNTSCTIYAGKKDAQYPESMTVLSGERFDGSFRSDVLGFINEQSENSLSEKDLKIFPAFFGHSQRALNELVYEVKDRPHPYKVSLFGDKTILQLGILPSAASSVSNHASKASFYEGSGTELTSINTAKVYRTFWKKKPEIFSPENIDRGDRLAVAFLHSENLSSVTLRFSHDEDPQKFSVQYTKTLDDAPRTEPKKPFCVIS